MKAISIVPRTNHLELLEIEAPQIKKQASDIDKVLIKVEEIGVSTIDKRIASGEPCEPPPGSSHIILGHEMKGRVVDIGAEAEGFNIGDLVVPTVRRGCGLCTQCVRGNSDLCLSGLYCDRGIRRLDGYMTEYVVERVGYIISIPNDLESVAVLLAPLSIAEKAVAAAVSIGHRMDGPYPFPEHAYHYQDWGIGKTGFVIGGTATAVMTAFLLRLNLLNTYLVADKPKDSILASVIEEIGAFYLESGSGSIDNLLKELGRVDLVIEATGEAKFDFRLAELIGNSGVLAVTTTPATGSKVLIDGNDFLRERVLRSQVIFGAVGANRRHFDQGVKDLQQFKNKFGTALEKVITHRYPFLKFGAAFYEKDKELIKAVLEV